MHIGTEYAVSFPFGETRNYTLKEIHNTIEPNSKRYTFTDDVNTVTVSNAVAERLTIKPVIHEPKARFMMCRYNPLTGQMEEKAVQMRKTKKSLIRQKQQEKLVESKN